MFRLRGKPRFSALLVAACVSLGLAPAPAQQPAPALTFTVLDRQRQFVQTLSREDIRVLDDGVPQEIVTFERRTSRPLSLVLLLDISPSQTRTLSNSKMAVYTLVDAVARQGEDRIAVATFAGDTVLEQELTSDLERVRGAIMNVKLPPLLPIPLGGPRVDPDAPAETAVWDAIWVVTDEVLSATPADTRRAIVLLTDGMDTKVGRKKLDDAVERAVRAGVAVYVIGIADLYYYDLEKSPLRKVAERTGGRAFFPKKKTDLPAVFAELEQELRSQYVVTFRPPAGKRPGKSRKLKIELVNPELRKQVAQLSHPQGY